MNKMRVITVLLLFFAVVVSGCKKDETPTQPPTPGTIAGRITDIRSFLPIANVSVSTNPASAVVTTDPGGIYNISGVSPGQYTITATKTGYNQNSVIVSVTAGAMTSADIALSIIGGSVQGKVTAALSGLTVAGATITTQPSTSTTQTDSSGNYSLPSVPAGTYAILATKTGYVTGTSNVSVASGSTLTANIALVYQAPANGLVAYYPFNGNAKDQSGLNYDGIVYGATLAMDRFQMANSAYQFDGSSNYIDIPNTSNLNFQTGGFSLAAWINFTDDSGVRIIIGKHIHGSENGFDLSLEPGRVEFFLVSKFAIASDSSMKGGWHFVCGMYDGVNGYFYLDGQLKATTPMSYAVTNTTSIKIGSNHTPGYLTSLYFFKGLIDDVRIYNRPLTPAEVQVLYHEGGW